MNSAALYVHIPFCLKKCSYCDFFSVENSGRIDNLYLECLKNEAAFYAEKYKIDFWRTIYIGGGTPSLLSASQIENLAIYLKNSCLCKNITPLEFTIEMNPESVSKEKLDSAWKNGITRLSLGIQSLNENALRAVERHCNVETAISALETVKSCWKGELSLDAIAGLPCQSEKEFLLSLEKIISYNPGHISLYTLTVEEKTPLARNISSGKINFDFDEADSQWLSGRDLLLKNGFFQYEVSNFCQNGKKSIHNSSYWAQKDYVGIGCSACGTFYGNKSFRWTNTENLSEYENFWSKPFPLESEIPRSIEEFSLETREFEFLMMGLRTFEGLNSARYRKNFRSVEPWNGDLEKRLEPVREFGVKTTENPDGSKNFSLTEDTILFLNKILLEL